MFLFKCAICWTYMLVELPSINARKVFVGSPPVWSSKQDKQDQRWAEEVGEAWCVMCIIGLVSGKTYRKPWILPSNIGGSWKFSHHPFLWVYRVVVCSAIWIYFQPWPDSEFLAKPSSVQVKVRVKTHDPGFAIHRHFFLLSLNESIASGKMMFRL